MTQTGTQTQTHVEKVRFIFHDHDYTLGDLRAELDRLDDLMTLLYRSHTRVETPEVLSAGTRVTRIIYKSPLEITLAIAGLAGTATAVTMRLFRIYERIWEVQLHKDKVQAEREVIALLRDQLAATGDDDLKLKSAAVLLRNVAHIETES